MRHSALIIHDKEEDRHDLTALLEGHGWQVETARHGAEALTKASQNPPLIAISDLLMPVMDGYTLMRHWKADAALCRIPFVVYTTTYAEAADEELALTMGADAFIQKPCAPEAFMAKIEAVLQHSRTPGPSLPSMEADQEQQRFAGYSRALIRKLEEEIRVSEQARLENKKLNDELTERMKELRLLFKVSNLLRNQSLSLASMAAELATLLPEGMMLTEQAQARVQLGNTTASTPGFHSVKPSLLVTFQTSDGVMNQLEVIYRDPPTSDEDLFLAEERALLDSVAEMLRAFLEQRLLTQRLELEHSRFLTAQAVANMGSWETDIRTGTLSWSEQTHRIFGTDAATFRPTLEWLRGQIHPDDRESFDLAVACSRSQRTAQELTHRIIRADGEVRYVIERWQVFADDHDTPVKSIGAVQDVTERILAQQDLQRTSNLLHAVADGLPDAVFVKDREGRYLLFNQGAAKLVGKPVHEVLGKDDTSLFVPKDAALVMEHDRKVITTGCAMTQEEVLTASGITRTYLARKAPYLDSHGQIIGVIGISSDITQRKRAEEKLREQATLLDKAQDAILVRDLDQRVLYWNKSAERLYGWTAEEALGRTTREMLYQDASEMEKALQVVFDKGEWVGELQQINRKGETLIIEGHWTLVCHDDGQPRCILSINTDITQRKKLEQHILRAQRLDSIGRLAGGIAHDLNNVLAPILMSIELLSAQEKDAQRQRILGTMEASAKRGAEMVRQVLSFARGVEGSHQPVDAARLLEDIEKIANDTFLKAIDIVRESPEGLWTIQGDETQLHQVLLNLCVNARDAMPNGGTLYLSAKNVVLDETATQELVGARPGSFLQLQIRDTGSGMTPEVLEHIFEPFYTTKAVGQGTGLGLSTSLAILKSHGGFLDVESEPGQGTCFTLYFPAGQVACPKMSAPTPLLPHGHGETILLIDDEACVRESIARTLEAYGYQVLLASDGVEALALYAAQGKRIGLILTDMMLPLMDGASIIESLRRLNPKVRIIALSGLNASQMISKASDAAIQHFLPKPCSTELLLKVIHECLHPVDESK